MEGAPTCQVATTPMDVLDPLDAAHGEAWINSSLDEASAAARERCTLDDICRTIAPEVAASPRPPTAKTTIAITTSISVTPRRTRQIMSGLYAH